MKVFLKAEGGRITVAHSDVPATIAIVSSTGAAQGLFAEVVPLEQVNEEIYAAVPNMKPLAPAPVAEEAEPDKEDEVPF